MKKSFLNFQIKRGRSVDVRAELEPPRLLRGDGKRPDGASLDPWHSGHYLVWDFICPDTLAPSHLRQSSLAAGSVAASAEGLKNIKYAQLVSSGDFIFAPIAVETQERKRVVRRLLPCALRLAIGLQKYAVTSELLFS